MDGDYIMKKLRWLKEWKKRKVGDISNASEKSAKNFVSQGYAEYVQEEVKPIKVKKEKKIKLQEEITYPPINELYEEIAKYGLELDPIKEDDFVEEMSKKYGKKKESIKKYIKQSNDSIKKTEELIKEEAGADLTERQFYVLKKNVGSNEMLDKYVEQGLDFINSNNIVKSYCRNFINSIMEGKRADINLKTEVLSLMHRKMFGEATELLVKEIENKNYIYTTKTDKAPEIFIYQEGIYIPEGESIIKEQLRKILEEDYNEWIANQVLAKIKADSFIEKDKFFRERLPFEVPVQNGILNLITLELTEFKPDKIFFSKLPVKYEEGAICEKIDKFLSDILTCEEDKDVFYELAGFGLIKDYVYEKAFMFIGNGRNGKGKSLELLKRLVGVNNCTAVALSSLDHNSPFIDNLRGKFFNLAGDISSKDFKDTGMFKQLTGRDLISANRKFKNAVEFCNYAKFVFSCNDLPRVYDYSDGFWERWVLLEYPYKFVEEDIYNKLNEEEKKMCKIKDPQIIEKITTPEEMSGFLNMAILGLHRLLNNKKFSYTKGCVEVKNKWIRKADSFMAFCMDKIESDYSKRISKKELRQKYKDYCLLHKINGVSDKSIKSTLQEMFGVTDESKYENFMQEWFWIGIKWKEENDYKVM